MTRPESPRPRHSPGRWILLALFAVAAVSILVGELSRAFVSIASRSWPTVTGTVIASGLRTVQVKGGYAFEPQVTYRYAVGDEVFEGHALSASDAPDTEQMARIILASYPVGRSVQVYVDPADPAHSLTQPGLNSGTVLSILLGLVILAGAGVMLAWRRRKRDRR